MSKLARDNRNRDIRRIHTMQRALGQSPADAESLKLSVTGVSSSADMSHEQRARYIRHLQGLVDALPRDKAAKAPTKARPRRPTPSADAAPLVRRIRAQLISLDRLPDAYADGIAKQMLGDQAPKFFEWCQTRDLYKISQALGVEQQRKGAPTK
jgi:hypothetical protein